MKFLSNVAALVAFLYCSTAIAITPIANKSGLSGQSKQITKRDTDGPEAYY
ncbi:hypothetical protein F5Y19DRAFT_475219 [Xylariaceae sp. FL1651]|nr:hypothetical protein F5Y19DRAFT_475219 [Xylariaceae sp. FL1651]